MPRGATSAEGSAVREKEKGRVERNRELVRTIQSHESACMPNPYAGLEIVRRTKRRCPVRICNEIIVSDERAQSDHARRVLVAEMPI